MKKKILQMSKRFAGLFPHKLPQGGAEFDAWAAKILDLYGFNKDITYTSALGTMIMQLGPTVHYKAYSYFGRCIHKSQANQVAYSKIQEAKRELEKREALERQAEEDAKKSKLESLSVSDSGTLPIETKV